MAEIIQTSGTLYNLGIIVINFGCDNLNSEDKNRTDCTFSRIFQLIRTSSIVRFFICHGSFFLLKTMRIQPHSFGIGYSVR